MASLPSGAPESPAPGDGAPAGKRRGPVARALLRELEAHRELLRAARAILARAWARRPTAPRAAAMAFVAAVAAAGAWAVLAQGTLPGRLPSARDWTALATLLERDARPGDAVALAPAWAERARAVVPATVPVLAQARLAGEDLVGVRRVWLVALPGAPGIAWDAELDLVQRASRSDPPERLGGIEVTRYELAFPALPLAFLPDRLADAAVTLGGAPCARDPVRGFRCDGAPPVRVAREVRGAGGAPRACLVATVGGDAPLAITFGPQRIGRVVRGHAGALGAGAGAPLRVSVLVEGEEAGAAEVALAGYVPFQVDTTRFAGHPRPLTLVLTRPAAPIELCLDAVTLP